MWRVRPIAPAACQKDGDVNDITHGRDHREQSLGGRFHPASDTVNDHSKTDSEALGLCLLMDREAKFQQLADNETLVVGH